MLLEESVIFWWLNEPRLFHKARPKSLILQNTRDCVSTAKTCLPAHILNPREVSGGVRNMCEGLSKVIILNNNKNFVSQG